MLNHTFLTFLVKFKVYNILVEQNAKYMSSNVYIII